MGPRLLHAACFWLTVTLVLISAWSPVVTFAQENITLDNDDPAISYSEGWQLRRDPGWDYGGTHMLVVDPELIPATASLRFKGSAVYYLAPKWPYPVSASIYVDDGPITVVDMEDRDSPGEDGDPPTVRSAVVAAIQDLDPKKDHTLTIFGTEGVQYLVLDALMYSSAPSPAPAISNPTPSETTPRRQSEDGVLKPLAIGMGIGFGCSIFLILIVWGSVVWLRRHKDDDGDELEYDPKTGLPLTLVLEPLHWAPMDSSTLSDDTSSSNHLYTHLPQRTEQRRAETPPPSFRRLVLDDSTYGSNRYSTFNASTSSPLAGRRRALGGGPSEVWLYPGEAPPAYTGELELEDEAAPSQGSSSSSGMLTGSEKVVLAYTESQESGR